MKLDQQLRSDLRTAVDGLPSRHGSLDTVVSAGSRRRTITRFTQLAATAVVLGAVGVGAFTALGPPAPDRPAAGRDTGSTIGVGGFAVVVDGLLPGFEEQLVYRAGPGPSPTASTDRYGPEQALEMATPPAIGLEAVGAPSIFLGGFPLISDSGFLYTDDDGLACIWLERQPGEAGYEWCIDTAYTRGGAVQWMIEPASADPADGATIVIAWYGLPARTSIVTATVDGDPVGWQRVTGGAVVLTASVDLGSDLVLTGRDASGTMIDFGRDDTGRLITGEQHFDDLTFEGIGQ